MTSSKHDQKEEEYFFRKGINIGRQNITKKGFRKSIYFGESEIESFFFRKTAQNTSLFEKTINDAVKTWPNKVFFLTIFDFVKNKLQLLALKS